MHLAAGSTTVGDPGERAPVPRLARAPAALDLRSPTRAVLVALAFLVLHGLLGELSRRLGTDAGVAAWYPAAGLSLAAVLLVGWPAVALVAVADLLQRLWNGDDFGAAATLALAAIQAGVWGAAGLWLRRRLPRRFADTTPRELWWLALGLTAAALASALGQVAIFVSELGLDWSRYGDLVRQFAIGDGVGVLSATPALLGFADLARGDAADHVAMVRARPRETLAMALAVIAVPVFGVITIEYAGLSLAVLPIAWVALRRGLLSASVAMLFWSLAAAAAFAMFAADTPLARLSSLMLATGLLSLFTGAVVTERQRAWRRMAELTKLDGRSGLPNREGLIDATREALQRDPGAVAMVLVRATRLDALADEGPKVLDATLRTAVERLRAVTPAGATLSRVASGHLAILLDRGELGDGGLDALADRVVGALSPPAMIGGREYPMGPVAGLATSQPGDDAEALLERATRAVVLATPAGSGTARFDGAMVRADAEEREIAADLQEAMRTGDGLALHFQPIVELRTGEIVGAEALVRWRHPQRGNIPPLDFIPVAERRGLILPLGRWILETACRHAASWPAVGAKPMTVQVNVSPVQLRGDGIINDTRNALRSAGLEPGRLCLELTEGAVVDDFDVAIARLHDLAELGVQVALDDFGTGHSSLQWLQRLPVRALKIDRSFVSGVGTQAVDLAIVDATIGLARAMHLDVVAEGVETPAQMATLRSLSCPTIQGYLVSRPLAEPEFRRWLGEHAGGPIGR